MFVYALIIALAVGLAYIYQILEPYSSKNGRPMVPRGIFLFLSFAVLFVLSGFRYNVGTDYSSYLSLFERLKAGEVLSPEPAFALLSKGAVTISNSPQMLIAISAFITLLIVFLEIKRDSKYQALSVYLFCSMSFLFYSFNAVKQFIAIAIIFYAWKYLTNRELRKYLLAVLIATLFHKTALIMLPIYFLVNYKYKRAHYIILATLAYGTLQIKDSLVTYMVRLYPAYKGTGFLLSTTAGSEIFIFTCAIVGLLAYYLLKNKSISRDDADIRISLNVVFFAAIMHTLLTWVPLADRLILYLDIYFILIIPLLISKIKSKSWRIALTIFFVLYTALYTYISIGVNGSHNAIPYDSTLLQYSRGK